MVAKKSSKIKNLDVQIFSTLYKARRPLPVKKIAERIDVSWPTANAYVRRLKKMGVVETKKSVRKTSVKINPEFLKKWKKPLFA